MLFSDGTNVVGRSKNCSAERSVLECSGVQMIKYNFLSLPLNLHINNILKQIQIYKRQVEPIIIFSEHQNM